MSQILGAFKQVADKCTCDLHLWPVRVFSCFRSDQPNSRISTSATHYVSQILGNNPFCLVTPAFDWYLPVSYMYKKSTSLTRACLNLEVLCRWSLFRKLNIPIKFVSCYMMLINIQNITGVRFLHFIVILSHLQYHINLTIYYWCLLIYNYKSTDIHTEYRSNSSLLFKLICIVYCNTWDFQQFLVLSKMNETHT